MPATTTVVAYVKLHWYDFMMECKFHTCGIRIRMRKYESPRCCKIPSVYSRKELLRAIGTSQARRPYKHVCKGSLRVAQERENDVGSLRRRGQWRQSVRAQVMTYKQVRTCLSCQPCGVLPSPCMVNDRRKPIIKAAVPMKQDPPCGIGSWGAEDVGPNDIATMFQLVMCQRYSARVIDKCETSP